LLPPFLQLVEGDGLGLVRVDQPHLLSIQPTQLGVPSLRLGPLPGRAVRGRGPHIELGPQGGRGGDQSVDVFPHRRLQRVGP
jgi:hypothetical protein